MRRFRSKEEILSCTSAMLLVYILAFYLLGMMSGSSELPDMLGEFYAIFMIIYGGVVFLIEGIIYYKAPLGQPRSRLQDVDRSVLALFVFMAISALFLGSLIIMFRLREVVGLIKIAVALAIYIPLAFPVTVLLHSFIRASATRPH